MKKFNREKALRKIEFKRKWRSYSRYVYIAVPCVLCCLLCLYFAYSKFFVSEEQAVIRTTVGDFIHGDVISAYIDGEFLVQFLVKMMVILRKKFLVIMVL